MYRFRLFTNRLWRRILFLVQGTELGDKVFLKLFSIPNSSLSSMDLITNHFRRRAKPVLFIENIKGKAHEFFQKEPLTHARGRIIEEADRVCNHSFELLGARLPHLGQIVAGGQSGAYVPIDWHTDFKTGYRWNQKKIYLDIEIPRGKADIKVPWELSRFQHLSSLGQAYWITGNEKYTEEFVNQISDWIENNPPQRGVNWSCTMDVAIRVANLIAGYYFFKDSKVIPEDFLIKLLKSLLIHGRHIMSNLENKDKIVNNHYISNIVGLLYLGVLFPECSEAKKWKEFGVQELKKEIQKQIYSDGCDFEGSTCYHRLALELFFYPTLLIVINSDSFDGGNYKETMERVFGNDYTEKLYKMFDAVLYLLKSNSKMPQIGDNDNGRLHKFSSHETLDMRYLLTFAAIFFRESRFKIKEFGFSKEALWIFGEEGYKTWQSLEENQLANIGSYAFSAGGWYIMRNVQDYMIISAGPNGLNGFGGHNHNDKLSFELCVDNEEIIVDPGTYVYTPEPSMRNLFRATAYHNTVVIDGKEQNRFNERSLFELKNDADVKCLKWEDNVEENLFIGEHNRYVRLREPVVHRRTVRFLKRKTKWIIKDEFYRFDNEGGSDSLRALLFEHTFNWFFHLAPQIVPEEHEKDKVLLRGEKSAVNLVIINSPVKGISIIEDGWVSSEYGRKLRSKILRFEYRSIIPFKIEFVIEKLSG